jgi:phosphatidylglycerol lysyltransferase
MKGIWRLAEKQPFALGFALTLLIAAMLTGLLRGPHRELRVLLGTGYESVVDLGHWWSLITYVFFTNGLLQLVIALVAAVLVLGFAERLLGTLRTTIVFVSTAVLGALLGIVIQGFGLASGELWSQHVSELWALDPFAPVAGCIMAASCFAGPLWRRRIRVLTLASVVVLLLFSGQPSDVYRVFAALVGLGMGLLFRPQPVDFTWRRSSHHETRTLLAAVVGVVAVGPLVTSFSGGRFGILAPLGMLFNPHAPSAGNAVDNCLLGNVTRECAHELAMERLGGGGPVLVSLLPLLVLLIAAFGLARGRRFAAWIAIGVNLGLAALGAWYYGLFPSTGATFVWQPHASHYWEIALVLTVSVLAPTIVALVLVLNLQRFPVRSRPGGPRTFVITTVATGLGLAALYVGGGWLLRDSFRPPVSFLDLLADVPERFIPSGFLRLERVNFLPGDWLTGALYHWVGPLFWIVVIVGVILCLRSAPGRVDQQGAERLRELLLAGGGGSLGFMATWEGNSNWFNSAGTTAIAYRVVNGVAITTSEPIGPAADGPAAAAEFATFCDDHGWIPVFYSLHEEWIETFEAMGWATMGVGEETLLRPRTWDTTGKKWQDIRSSVNRADRAGVRAEWTSYRALPVLVSTQIAEISEQWVQEKELPELGFTLGGLDELHDPAVRLMLAVDTDGRVHAVTSWLPSYRDGVVIGWTLDFMRRRPESMNGVMEFLIAQTARMMSEQPEIEFLSLSAAPLATTPGRDAAGEPADLPSRMLDFLGRVLEPVYGFRSLFAFKRKFQPELQPLIMAFPDAVALPAIGLALARAYLPSLSVREALVFARGLGDSSTSHTPASGA